MNLIPSTQPFNLQDQIPARHDTMVALVERQIEATDKQIDTLVYELHGLTEEEIGIVEGVGK